MSDVQIQQVLSSMRALQARLEDSAATHGGAQTGALFSSVLRSSIAEVNASQQTATDLATKFQQGAPDVGLPEVMISIQKASLQFEAITQVRNRLVAAYQEIMNMQV
jgi:flagellar hook-basal body complex protein FliE